MRDEPERFKTNGYQLYWMPKGNDGSTSSIWVGNGIIWYELERPVRVKFSFVERIAFHKAYKVWIEFKLKEVFDEND